MMAMPEHERHRLEHEIAELQRKIIATDDAGDKRALSDRLARLEAQVEEWR